MPGFEKKYTERGISGGKSKDKSSTKRRSSPSDGSIPRCAIHDARMPHWHALTNPLLVLKMGIENVKQHFHQLPTKDEAIISLECCESALSAMEAYYHRMREQHNGMQSMGGVNLDLFMHQEEALFMVQAQKSQCSLVFCEFHGLPRIDMGHQCMACFFDRFLADAFEVGCSSGLWNLEFTGSAENGYVHVRIVAHHPENERILSEIWDRTSNEQRQLICQSPLKADLRHTAGCRSLELTMPALSHINVWERGSCG